MFVRRGEEAKFKAIAPGWLQITLMFAVTVIGYVALIKHFLELRKAKDDWAGRLAKWLL